MSFLIDSYSESNQDGIYAIYSGSAIAIGQSFTNNIRCILDSCKFYLCKTGSPTGNVTATIYEHTGNYGADGYPTGSALATSDTISIASLNTYPTFALQSFVFSGIQRITLSANTYYVIIVNFNGGDSGNYLTVGFDDSGPSHSGDRSSSTDLTNWSANPTDDVCFYIYGVNIIGALPTFFPN